MSNIRQREAIYQRSLVSRSATGIIADLGGLGDELAIEAVAGRILRSERL